jgi:hypothetical protein
VEKYSTLERPRSWDKFRAIFWNKEHLSKSGIPKLPSIDEDAPGLVLSGIIPGTLNIVVAIHQIDIAGV